MFKSKLNVKVEDTSNGAVLIDLHLLSTVKYEEKESNSADVMWEFFHGIEHSEGGTYTAILYEGEETPLNMRNVMAVYFLVENQHLMAMELTDFDYVMTFTIKDL